jgi:hypothetical protein
MGMHERDPRNIGYASLCKAIIWYKEITPEAAIRIIQGKSSAKPGNKLTPEIRAQILKLIENPNFKSLNVIEKKFKINRYDIIESEEVFTLGQIEKHLKQLKTITEACNGDCSKCFLDTELNEDKLTMCEFLQDIDLENPQRVRNKQSRKIKKNLDELFTGEKVKRNFEIYKPVHEEFEKYLQDNGGKKIRDIVSAALAEYISRHK